MDPRKKYAILLTRLRTLRDDRVRKFHIIGTYPWGPKNNRGSSTWCFASSLYSLGNNKNKTQKNKTQQQKEKKNAFPSEEFCYCCFNWGAIPIIQQTEPSLIVAVAHHRSGIWAHIDDAEALTTVFHPLIPRSFLSWRSWRKMTIISHCNFWFFSTPHGMSRNFGCFFSSSFWFLHWLFCSHCTEYSCVQWLWTFFSG